LVKKHANSKEGEWLKGKGDKGDKGDKEEGDWITKLQSDAY